jgi:hypothetical protein
MWQDFEFFFFEQNGQFCLILFKKRRRELIGSFAGEPAENPYNTPMSS